MPEKEALQDLDLDEHKYDFVDEEKHVFRTQPGLTEEVVRQVSALKDEPEWIVLGPQIRFAEYLRYPSDPRAEIADLLLARLQGNPALEIEKLIAKVRSG